MKYLFKFGLTIGCSWLYNVYEHNVTLYEQKVAVYQLSNDVNYMVSRFFAEGTSIYVGWLLFIVALVIWYKELVQLHEWIIKKIKQMSN